MVFTFLTVLFVWHVIPGFGHCILVSQHPTHSLCERDKMVTLECPQMHHS
jgi:hypothetical protein